METVMEYVSSQLNKRLNFIYFKQMPQRRLQVFLTDNYLEIDIGYGAYTSAAAFRKDWKVLFDKSGTVDKAMRTSWEKHEMAPKANELDKKLAECSDAVWHNLMHSAVAIKRRQYTFYPLRAAGEPAGTPDSRFSINALSVVLFILLFTVIQWLISIIIQKKKAKTAVDQ